MWVKVIDITEDKGEASGTLLFRTLGVILPLFVFIYRAQFFHFSSN